MSLGRALPTKGGPIAAVNYALGMVNARGERRCAEPQVIGNIEHFVQAALCSNLRHTYLSLVISYQESAAAVSLEDMAKDAEAFVRALNCGIPMSRIAWAAISHQRISGCDVHVLVSKEDLLTGKQMPLWSSTSEDIAVCQASFKVINLERGLSCGQEVREWRLGAPHIRAELQEVVDAFRVSCTQDLSQLVSIGTTKKTSFSNEQLTIEDEHGYTYTFTTGLDGDGKIRVASPNQPDCREHRRRDPKRIAQEIERAREDLHKLTSQRALSNAHRFGSDDLDEHCVEHLSYLARFGDAEATIDPYCRGGADFHLFPRACDDIYLLTDEPVDRVCDEANPVASSGRSRSRKGGPTAGAEAIGISRMGEEGGGAKVDVYSARENLVADQRGTTATGEVPLWRSNENDMGDPSEQLSGKTLTNESTEQHDNDYEDISWLAAQRRKRGLRAAAILRGIGAALSRIGAAVRGTLGGAQSNQAIQRATDTIDRRLNDSARQIAGSVEKLAHAGGIQCFSVEVRADLELVDANCSELDHALNQIRSLKGLSRRPLPTPTCVIDLGGIT